MITFYKYHGTGNDFIILDQAIDQPDQFAKKICDRHFGIGADGLIYPSSSTIANIKFNYYNSDGSIAKMCGNGLRCFVKHVYQQQLIKQTSFLVETLAGIIPVVYDVESDQIEIRLGQAIFNFTKQDHTTPSLHMIGLGELKVPLYSVELMTQHAILFHTQSQMKNIAYHISTHRDFPQGVNVNFVEIENEHTMRVETYERGAGWTLSCGTGSSASAALAIALGHVKSPVTVIVPGGNLMVRSDDDVYLKGPATLIAQGEYHESV